MHAGKAKLTVKALELPEVIPQKGLEPDVITCSATISACVKAKQSEKTLELLEEMPQKA